MAKKIRKGDDVIVLTGKDKGRTGTVLKMITDNDRALVEGVNMVKKHQKPNPNAGVQGGIIDMEKPIHISNIAIYNAQTKKADKVGFKFLKTEGDEKSRKVRIFKSTGETMDV